MQRGFFARGTAALGLMVLLLLPAALAQTPVCPSLTNTKLLLTAEQPQGGGGIPAAITLYFETFEPVQGKALPQLEIHPVEGGQVFVIQNDNAAMAPCRAMTGADGKAQITLSPGFQDYDCRAIRAVFCPNASTRDEVAWCTGVDFGTDAAGIPICAGASGPMKVNGTLAASQASAQACPDARTYVNTPFCGLVGLIFGLLLAAAFFQGRNPLHMFDFGAARGLRVSKGGGYIPMTQNVNVNPVAIATALVQTADQIGAGSAVPAEDEAPVYRKPDGSETPNLDEAKAAWKGSGKELPGGVVPSRMVNVPVYVGPGGKHTTDPKQALRDDDGKPMRLMQARGWKAMDQQDYRSRGQTIIGGFFGGLGQKAANSLGIDNIESNVWRGLASSTVNLAVRMAPNMLAAGLAKKRKGVRQTKLLGISFDKEMLDSSLRSEALKEGIGLGISLLKDWDWIRKADEKIALSGEAKAAYEAGQIVKDKEKEIAELKKNALGSASRIKELEIRLAEMKRRRAPEEEIRQVERMIAAELSGLRAALSQIDPRIAQIDHALKKANDSLAELDRREYHAAKAQLATESDAKIRDELKDAIRKYEKDNGAEKEPPIFGKMMTREEIEVGRSTTAIKVKRLQEEKEELLDKREDVFAGVKTACATITAYKEEIGRIRATGQGERRAGELEADVKILEAGVTKVYVYAQMQLANSERLGGELAKLSAKAEKLPQELTRVEELGQAIKNLAPYAKLKEDVASSAALPSIGPIMEKYAPVVRKVAEIDAQIRDMTGKLETAYDDAGREKLSQEIQRLNAQKEEEMKKAPDVDVAILARIGALEKEYEYNLKQADGAQAAILDPEAAAAASNRYYEAAGKALEEKYKLEQEVVKSAPDPVVARMGEIDRKLGELGQMQQYVADPATLERLQTEIIELEENKFQLQKGQMTPLELQIHKAEQELGSKFEDPITGEEYAKPTGLYLKYREEKTLLDAKMREQLQAVDVRNVEAGVLLSKDPGLAAAEVAERAARAARQGAGENPHAMLEAVVLSPYAKENVDALLKRYDHTQKPDSQQNIAITSTIVRIISEPGNVEGLKPFESLPKSLQQSPEFVGQYAVASAAAQSQDRGADALSDFAGCNFHAAGNAPPTPEAVVNYKPQAQQAIDGLRAQLPEASPERRAEIYATINSIMSRPDNIAGLKPEGDIPQGLFGSGPFGNEYNAAKAAEDAAKLANGIVGVARGRAVEFMAQNYVAIVDAGEKPEDYVVLDPESRRRVDWLRKEQEGATPAKSEQIAGLVKEIVAKPLAINTEASLPSSLGGLAENHAAVVDAEKEAQGKLEPLRQHALSSLGKEQEELAEISFRSNLSPAGPIGGLLDIGGTLADQMLQTNTANFGHKSDKAWAAYLGPIMGSLGVSPFVYSFTGMTQAAGAQSVYDRMRQAGQRI